MEFSTANPEMVEAWDGAEGAQWTRLADHFELSMRAHGLRMLDAAAITATDRVLDVGCGTGVTTIDAASRAKAGSALGVDLSSQMLERARSRSADLDNVSFEQADAQVHPFEDGSVHVVISRFGTMFFSNANAAFANIGRALSSGGRLVIVVWQSLDRNEWMNSLIDTLAMGRDVPTPPAGAPGPFGLADPERVERVLGDAGFEDVHLEEVRESVRLGSDAEDAYGFVSNLGMTNGLLAELDDDRRAQALGLVRAKLEEHDTGDGVLFDSAAWLVTARRG
jgi:SAM-dependent methyltransferase